VETRIQCPNPAARPRTTTSSAGAAGRRPYFRGRSAGTARGPLEDPLPPGDADLLDEDAPAFDGEEGCPKCGHDSATVDDIATTSTGLTRLLDLQNRTFAAAVCDRRGYTEFYRRDRPSASGSYGNRRGP